MGGFDPQGEFGDLRGEGVGGLVGDGAALFDWAVAVRGDLAPVDGERRTGPAIQARQRVCAQNADEFLAQPALEAE